MPEYAVVSARNDGSVVLLARSPDCEPMLDLWHSLSGPVVLVRVGGDESMPTTERVTVHASKAEPAARLQRRTMFRVAVLGLMEG